MKKLSLFMALLMSTVAFAQDAVDPTLTAKYWVDLYRQRKELHSSYFDNDSYRTELEIQKIDALLDVTSLEDKLEKLREKQLECEEALSCSREDFIRLYNEIRTLSIHLESNSVVY